MLKKLEISKAHLNFAQYRNFTHVLFCMKTNDIEIGEISFSFSLFFHIACGWKQIKFGLEKSEKMFHVEQLTVFHDWLVSKEMDCLRSSEV